ncbi:MAG: hypothetical protein QOJ45_470 [Verrucomicrobiota bacterium]|jgi:hypothetical protein
MRLRHVYLGLCVIGTALPYFELIPWLRQHGLDLPLFFRELFGLRIGAFFGMDVIVSALVLFVFIYAEGARVRVRHLWAPVLGTFFVGVSLGLPLFLYLRQRKRDQCASAR